MSAQAMTPQAWTKAQNAAISIDARLDAPVAAKDGWIARAARTVQAKPDDPQALEVQRFEGKGATPDAALLDLVAKLPGTVSEPRPTQGHCPTCTCLV